MMDLLFHEAADIFPPLGRPELQLLAEDIRQNGLQIPIELLDGKIIDGRSRYQACLKVDVEPDFIDVDPDDPVAYVLSMNLHRRHLNESQRAMVADRVKVSYAKKAKERQKVRKGKQPGASVANLPQLDKGKARDQAADATGVSGRSVDYASKVRQEGSMPLQQAVDAGTIPVSSAAKLVDLPKPEQTAIVKGGKPAVRKAVKKLDADAKKPDWAKGPTPQQEAENDPETRWCASLHKLYVFMTSTRDLGGIKELGGKWSEQGRKDYAAELKRIVGELTRWISILEGEK